MQALLKNNLLQVSRIFQKHKIKKAYAFGSVLSDQFNNESDIDLLVDIDETIDPVELGGHLWDLESELESLFGKEVDIITSRSMKNPYFISEVNRTRQLIYG